MKLARLSLLAAAALVVGCAGHRRPPRAGVPAPADWHAVATPADRARIRNWRGSWVAALARANAAYAGRVRAEGALLAPDAGLEGAQPPPGDYRCRMVKLGAQVRGGSDYAAYPPFACRITVEGNLLALAKLEGSQRPVGLLFPDGPARMVFLGTMMLGDERRALDYGRDPERDMIGAFERIGERRWRLALPAPRWESMLDVIELIPLQG